MAWSANDSPDLHGGDRITIQGYVDGIIFRNEGNLYTVFVIFVKGEEITCVGHPAEIFKGQFLEITGTYKNHETYGEQFVAEVIVVKEPHSREAFLRFISSGAVKGIGKKLGERIADRFGDDSYSVMLEHPEKLADIRGITIDKAFEFQSILMENRQINDAALFLQGLGIGHTLAIRIYKYYGEEVYDIIKTNPYLLAEDIKNIGFKTADDIARRLQTPISPEYRIRAACLYVLELGAEDGHTYLPMSELKIRTEKLLGIEVSDFEIFVSNLSAEQRLVSRISDDVSEGVRIYLPHYYRMEGETARHLSRLVGANKEDGDTLDGDFNEEDSVNYKRLADAESESGIELDEKQKEAVLCAMNGGVLVITGGPGTGKTTVINTILKVFLKQGLDIRLAAPTGKAAKRLGEASGMEAQTIHRLLGYGPEFLKEGSDSQDLRMRFEYNADNSLDCDVVIIDEMSMVDLWLIHALLAALSDGTRLIMAGDSDQLPSVGAGQVLKDIMDSNRIPVIRLDKIFRQAAESDIISNAHKINKGERVDIDVPSKDFLFIKRDNDERIIAAMYTLLTEKLPEYVGADSSEIQILTPSRVSKVGVYRLNSIMQKMLNPPSYAKRERVACDTLFREGDKVMQVKNDYEQEWSKVTDVGDRIAGTGVFNGDTGILRKIDTFSETANVEFDDGRFAIYNLAKLENLELAYAVTIHKSQGSEYPAVIIPMYPVPRMLMNRKLLYTAVTRARRCVCLVGMPECFYEMAESLYESKRYSTLKERICEMI